MIRELTQGKPLKLLLRFMLPLLLGNLFQQLYNTVDSVVVGQYLGKGALAAVGNTGSISFLIIGFVLGISSGFSNVIARHYGAKDEEAVRRAIGNAILLSVMIGGTITLLSCLLTRPMLRLMQTPADIFEDSYIYIFIIFLGIGATLLYNIPAGILRAIGDSRTPLYFLIVSAFFNITLDLLLTFGLKRGVEGVAIATVCSQLLSGLLCILYIRKKLPQICPSREDFRLHPHMARQLLANGLPMAFQFSITAVGCIMVQFATNTLGSDAGAAVTASGKTMNFFTTLMESLGIAIATYSSQNIGAGRIDRVREGICDALLIGLTYTAVVMTIVFFLGRNISMLFIQAEEVAILDDVQRYLRWCACFFPMLQLIFILRNAIQGLGFSVPAMTAGLFELAGRGMVAFLLLKKLGFLAICISNPVAWVFADILLIPVYCIILYKLKKQFAHPQIL